jgi:hypothetical protein
MPKPPVKTIMSPFIAAPKEAAIIGRLLAGYGEIEFFILQILEKVLNHPSIAARLLFRLRSETNRLDIADAALCEVCYSWDLKDAYDNAMATVRYCLKIRNQYAHCHWLPETENGLFFCNLETPSKEKHGEIILEFLNVDESLLEWQETYFAFCQETLLWLRFELQHKLDPAEALKRSIPRFARPKGISQPPLHNPPEKHPIPQAAITRGKPTSRPPSGSP